ncbi:hypothetical protein YTPLAS18_13070 [Nitrospira sp.]|nr:hypothetical protein YTPLAS18_13070 [Nitrospira sp.]
MILSSSLFQARKEVIEMLKKQAYTAPVLVKREQLRDVTAGVSGKYREKYFEFPR